MQQGIITKEDFRTWSWMTIGNIQLKEGEEKIVLRLTDLSTDRAAIIKSVRFTRQ